MAISNPSNAWPIFRHCWPKPTTLAPDHALKEVFRVFQLFRVWGGEGATVLWRLHAGSLARRPRECLAHRDTASNTAGSRHAIGTPGRGIPPACPAID